MSSHIRAGRRLAATVIAAGALAVGLAGQAGADPGCTVADITAVETGVAAGMTTYLWTHPDVNDFFTSLKGQPRDQIGEQVQNYLDANPTVRADLQAIRQPSVDFRNRCGAPATP